MRVDRVLLRDLSAALAVVTAAIASPVANPVAGTATLASISEEPIPGRIVNQFKYEGEPDFSKQIFKYANGTDVEVDMTTPGKSAKLAINTSPSSTTLPALLTYLRLYS